jgi:pimeloyl-ACP methyl ester carboxylesterase
MHTFPAEPPIPAEQRWVDAADGVRLWAERIPASSPHPAEPLLLIMGANASSQHWPDELVARLAQHRMLLRHDHRDTGRSSAVLDEQPYGIADLAADAIAVLDAFEVTRAHVLGMSMGGLLVQLLLLDHPERLASATLLCTGPLGLPDGPELPGPDPALLRMWAELDDPRDTRSELAWRVEHWRLLNGPTTPFDAAQFRALERRAIEHAGTSQAPTAHARLHTDGLQRGAELAHVELPVLVIEAPADPAFPPPNSVALAAAIGSARLVRIPGMGHAISRPVLDQLVLAVLDHTVESLSSPVVTTSAHPG